jgi:transcriptional regulator NrdR family protein
MNCPKCGAWSRVLATREKDNGHLSSRKRECANLHRFSTVEIHEVVFEEAKQAQANFLTTTQRSKGIAEALKATA